MSHVPVLLHESIEGLGIQKGDIFFDGTLGSGGHSAYVCRLLGGDVTLTGTDRDGDAIVRAKERVSKEGCVLRAVKGNYRDIQTVVSELGIDHVDRILLDLGFSSNQIADSGRGLSFQSDEPLLMTLSDTPDEESFTAQTIVNEWSRSHIEAILKGYGEEPFSGRIARAIVEAREKKPILTTADLVSIIVPAVPARYRKGRIHPATRTFQALRITVNDEIEVLREGLLHSMDILASGGRLAVISFHSLEDRIVKRFFKESATKGRGKILTKKPIVPTEKEQKENPRSRSAKLRIIEKQ